MNDAIRDDINKFVSSFKLSEEFKGAKFLITGATGLIGSILIKCLLALNSAIKIIAPVRNKKKAIDVVGEYESVDFIECDLSKFDYSIIGDVDYIVHGAAPTSSKFFVEHPVETIDSILSITKRLLDYARGSNIEGIIFLSSLEVYGQHLDSNTISEKDYGSINILDLRSSYPLAKQMAENICVAYASEYKLPVKIARLTQTTGPGISKDDDRVIVQFVRHAVNGQDIMLHTKGESSRPYCYTIDAVEAILYILSKGKAGEAYNVANESTYISAKDLAELVKETINPEIKIKYDLRNDMGYAPTTFLNLTTGSIQSLGWSPSYNLKDIISALYRFLK